MTAPVAVATNSAQHAHGYLQSSYMDWLNPDPDLDVVTGYIFCNRDVDFRYERFVSCYKDKAFCNRRPGQTCWDYCRDHMACVGELGRQYEGRWIIGRPREDQLDGGAGRY